MFHRKKEQKMDLYRKIGLTFFIISIIVAFLVFYISFSWATITIVQKPDYFNAQFSIKITERADLIAPNEVATIGKIIQKDMEAAGAFSAESSIDAPKRVRGIVTLVNTTAKQQPLREKTRLLNPAGILLRTTKFIIVPAGGTIEVEAIADKEGDLGVIQATRFTLPGLWPGLQDKIYGQGFVQKSDDDGKVHILLAEDLERAKQSLMEKLKEKFTVLLEKSKPQDDFRPQKLVKFIDGAITGVVVSAPLQTKTDQFDVRITARMTGVLADEVDLSLKIIERLKSQLALGQDLIPPAEHEVSYELGDVNVVEKTAAVEINATAGSILGQDMEIFNKQKLSGLTAEEILAYFKTYKDITDVHVRFYPFWVTRAPLLLDHIHILMKK